MRLLNTKTLKLEDFDGENVPQYAILSHRWENEEVTLKDMELGRAPRRRGYSKLESCCKLACSRGFKYAWIDTCCIDKSSSAELTESINSMYRWYQNAQECYAFLSDVHCQRLNTWPAQKEFWSSAWFTRGWTLQELIAPSNVLFFNGSWERLGEKGNLRRILAKATSIDEDVLCGKMSLSDCPISQRMSWAARRTTSRIEDRAYSLLGIFDVYMPMLYGEGHRAFRRLQEEIIKQSDDHTIFSWREKSLAKSVLAPSPSCFDGLGDMIRIMPTNDTTQGYTLVNAGLSIQLQLIPWSMNTYLAALRCGYRKLPAGDSRRTSFRGYDRTCIFLQQTEHDNQFFRVSVDGHDLKVIDGDELASMRDDFTIQDRQISIRQINDSGYMKPSKPAFYGFEFSFNHRGMFVSGRQPTSADVLCYHKWKPHEPVCEIATGKRRAAGLFRLSGFPGLFMYLGFDLDFAPLCLITTRSPRSRRFTLLPQDFNTINSEEALRLLDLNWLRSEIELGTQSGETILAFKGDRRTSTKAQCKSLSMSLTFEWKYSHFVDLETWHVSFAQTEGVNRHYDHSPLLDDVTVDHAFRPSHRMVSVTALSSPKSDNVTIQRVNRPSGGTYFGGTDSD